MSATGYCGCLSTTIPIRTPRRIRKSADLGRTLEALGRLAGAIDTTVTNAGLGSCLLSAFDWEHGEIEFFRPHLLKNRLGSPDPEDLITRLVTVTGIPEHIPEVPPEPEYVV